MAILRIRDADGNVQEILAIRGEDYVLTEADKQEIASIVASMVAASAVSLTDLTPDTSGFALKSDIPTKVSALENDAGYLTERQVRKMIDNAIGGGEPAVIISFSIESYQFQAEEGMTWREWVDSEYNSDGACVYNAGTDSIRFVEYSLDVLSPSNTPVKGSDAIISGYFYYLS